MESNCRKRSFSSNISCVSNINMLKVLKTCKSKRYLKLILMIIEIGISVNRRRVNCLQMYLHKGVLLRKIKEGIQPLSDQIKEKTMSYDMTNKYEVCFMMHSTFKVMNTCLWYLDSSCSRHMTGDRTLFKKFESKKGGNVTFGDRSKSQIKGKGIIFLLGVPNIANVLYVEGLKVNLLSIIQICDQDSMVLFSKGKCLVLNESGEQLISGIQTLDNCYGLLLDAECLCNSIQMPNEDLWH